jgi:hypothetical protein
VATYQEIREGAKLTTEIVNDYTIGTMAAAADIVGGADLQESSIDLLASVGVDLGYGGGIFESGQVAALTRPLIRAGLSKATRRAGKSFLANPAQFGKALAFASVGAGAGLGGYSWLTAGQAEAREVNRQKSEILAGVLETLSPADRAKIARILAEGMTTAGAPPLLWVGLGLAGLAGVYLWANR